MPLALVRAGPMRHLSVPSSMTQQTIDILRESEWLDLEHRIHPYDDGHILIPLKHDAPLKLQPPLTNFPIIDVDPVLWKSRESWQSRFTELAGQGVLENTIITKSHEILGDLLIQRHDEINEEYLSAFIQSKMETHPKIRLMLLDHGVKGEFRIRDLQPIAVREQRSATVGDGTGHANSIQVWLEDKLLSKHIRFQRGGRRRATSGYCRTTRRRRRGCYPRT